MEIRPAGFDPLPHFNWQSLVVVVFLFDVDYDARASRRVERTRAGWRGF